MLSKGALRRTVFGSFFIQSSWSFEKMQSLGFGAAIEPALEEIYAGDAQKRAEAKRRHLGFYNAHPFISSPVIGAAVRIEEMAARGECDPERAVRLKKAVMGPFSAIGDSFFWGSLRPLASCAGAATVLVFGAWGLVVFLALFNVFHLWMRLRGFENGYRLGEGVAGYIKGLKLLDRGRTARYLAALALGLLPALFVSRALGEAGASASRWGGALWALGMIPGALLINRLMSKGIRVRLLVWALSLPLIIYGILRY